MPETTTARMSRMTRLLTSGALLGALSLTALGLTGCAPAGTPGGTPPAPAKPTAIAAEGKVIGQGTVLQVGDAAPKFCLGPVRESYPPQCDGPEIIGWDWKGLDGVESAGGTTWGAYAVVGTWDGEKFTATDAPMLLALYDPMPVIDPYTQPDHTGTTNEARLTEVQDALSVDSTLAPLASWIENGYVFASYYYDDGDIQSFLDDKFGEDAVHVVSAFRILPHD